MNITAVNTVHKYTNLAGLFRSFSTVIFKIIPVRPNKISLKKTYLRISTPKIGRVLRKIAY